MSKVAISKSCLFVAAEKAGKPLEFAKPFTVKKVDGK